MKPQTIMKIANRTRNYSRFDNPIAYRAARMVLKKIYPVQPLERALKVVTDYYGGMIFVNTMFSAERDILFFGAIEPGITRLIERLVKPGDACLDIGANIGALTLLMAFLAGSGGKVIAVEPNPLMLDKLKYNLDLNMLDQVDIIPAAVSNTTCKTILYAKAANHYHQGGSSLQPSEILDHKYEINTIRGRVLQERLDGRQCKLIKIDVEGHDFIVLKELSGLIETHRPFIVMEYEKEYWDQHDCKVDQVRELLSGYEYHYCFMKKDMLFPLENQFPDACDIVCIPKIQKLAAVD